MGVIADSIGLLRRCPDLVKAIIAAGLLVSTFLVGGSLVLAEVSSEVWGENMAAYSAGVKMAAGVVSLFLGSAFGRLTDRMERRRGFALVGLLTFIPWYLMLVLGANKRGFYAFNAGYVLNGVTCLSHSGCPMIFAFANDVIPSADREVAFGILYVGIVAIMFIANLLGAAVARVFPGEALPVLLYILFLTICFFLTLCTVKPRAKEPEAVGTDQETRAPDADLEAPGADVVSCGEDGSGSEDHDSSDSNPNGARTAQSSEETTDDGACVESSDAGLEHKRASACSLFAPLRFTVEYPPLRYLCLTAALISLPEVALSDVTTQFIYAELGLQRAHDIAKEQLASMLHSYPALVAVLPAYFLAGHFGKRAGALRLARWLIPVAAIVQVVPMAMWVAHYMWFVPVVGISVALPGVVFLPLQAVNVQIAPEGRVGEALAGVGVAKQVAAVVMNLAVTTITPALRKIGVQSPLRYYFPVAGLLCLLASVPAALIRLPRDPEEGEGSRGRSPKVSDQASDQAEGAVADDSQQG